MEKYKPLIIIRCKGQLSCEQRAAAFKEVARGIDSGCLLLDSSLEILAFDADGRLVYPIPPLP